MNFEEILESRPYKKNVGSCPEWKLRHLYDICERVKPDLIVESGTFKGNSLWLFRNARPDAKIHSFDISYGALAWRDESIDYNEYDITDYGDSFNPKENDLIFFDDHQNQVERLKWAYRHGFKHIVFDDNIPADKQNLFNYPPEISLQEANISMWMPEILDEYIILPYDGSFPQGRNGGQTYLTYVKLS